jgi:hypothetical protein
MQETAHKSNPGNTMHNAFGHTKTMGETKMNMTKRSSVDQVEPSRKRNDDEDSESGEKHKKLGPPVAQPGVNTSSFLGV